MYSRTEPYVVVYYPDSKNNQQKRPSDKRR